MIIGQLLQEITSSKAHSIMKFIAIKEITIIDRIFFIINKLVWQVIKINQRINLFERL